MPPLAVRRSAAPAEPEGLPPLPARDPGSSPESSSTQLDVRVALPPPSRVLPLHIRLPVTRVQPRQDSSSTITTIPSTYGALNSSPDPGTVVGITLGSVGAFVIALWLLYTCINLGTPDTASSYGTASVVTRRSKHHHHHHKSPRRETVEIRANRGPVIVEEVPAPPRVSGERVERVVLEETRRTSSRGPPPRVVEDDDDEVVVIEEHTPPRRHRSKRRSSSPRRESGYREVDPDRYAGGDGPLRDVRRGSGSRRR